MRSLLSRFRKAIPLAYATTLPYRPVNRKRKLPGVWFDVGVVTAFIVSGLANVLL